MQSSSSSSAIPRRGYFYVILAAIFWAVSGSSGKFLFGRGVTLYHLVQMRLTLSVVLVFFLLLFRAPGLLRISRRDIFYFAVLGMLGMGMVQFTYFFTISKIQVAVAILLEYLAPTFIALYSVFFVREKLTRVTLIAIVLSTAGCYMAVGAYNFNLLAMNWQGILSGIGSGIAFALYAVLSEKGMRRYSPWTVLFYALLFATLLWNVVVPPLQAFGRSYSPVEWGWILYIVVLGTVVPYALYSEGISLIRSTRASVTATLEPITAAFISYWFLGESLQPPQILGGLLVIASVVFLQIRREYDESTSALIRARLRQAEQQ